MAGLDPDDWSELRALGHRMLDDMIDWLASPRDRPVWQRMPDEVRTELTEGTPPAGARPLPAIYEDWRRLVLPWGNGNEHPRFMGWVHGGGNPAGALGAMLAGFFNANCGGRDHAAIEVERLVIRWTASALGLPAESGGLLVTGTSAANLNAVLAARRAALGASVREAGIGGHDLIAYAGASVHGCVPRALDMAGLGTRRLRAIETDAAGRIELAALARAVAEDRAAGRRPFLVVGSAGTVDTGAVDDLAGLAAFCRAEGLWFHVDGAFGALAVLSPKLAPLLRGIEQADSVALDFHKWAQVPYDAGCVIVRDRQTLLDTFAQDLAYLKTAERGLAANPPWPRDLGPDLSRGFRALKVWFTLQAYGTEGIARVIEHACEVAQHLAQRVARESALELLAPVSLGIVCFRHVGAGGGADALNRRIVTALQERGIAAPSLTTVGGRTAIRAGIFNHRTERRDVEALVDAVLEMAGGG